MSGIFYDYSKQTESIFRRILAGGNERYKESQAKGELPPNC